MPRSDIHFSYTNADADVTQIQTASVITESEVETILSLKAAAEAIERLAKEGDDKILRNALKAATLKQRIINGEAGPDVKWNEWMVQNIHISKSHLYALVRIGSAGDPAKALVDWRRANNQRSKKRGDKVQQVSPNGEPISEDHQRMIDFILTLPPRVVKAEHLALWQRYSTT